MSFPQLLLIAIAIEIKLRSISAIVVAMTFMVSVIAEDVYKSGLSLWAITRNVCLLRLGLFDPPLMLWVKLKIKAKGGSKLMTALQMISMVTELLFYDCSDHHKTSIFWGIE